MTVHTGPRGHGRSHLPFESPPPASVPRTHGRSHVQHTCVRDHACAQEHVCVCGNTDGRPALLTQRRAQVRPPRWPRTARPAGPQSGPSGPRAAAVLREAGPLPSPPAVVIPPPRGWPGGRLVHAAPRSVGDARLRPPRTHAPPNRAAAARPAPPGSARLCASGRGQDKAGAPPPPMPCTPTSGVSFPGVQLHPEPVYGLGARFHSPFPLWGNPATTGKTGPGDFSGKAGASDTSGWNLRSARPSDGTWRRVQVFDGLIVELPSSSPAVPTGLLALSTFY